PDTHYAKETRNDACNDACNNLCSTRHKMTPFQLCLSVCCGINLKNIKMVSILNTYQFGMIFFQHRVHGVPQSTTE
ncbi:MAG: hypothetical protein VSS75_004945, partial [Candidatus Parabeggiatoa sp.]|nr:hypothetical protein [Candidatus Parabeggiatoa sp.]